MSSDIVVVSPHLDDAVLSASLQLLRPGARLVTVCTAEPPAAAPLGEWDRLTGAANAAERVRERYVEDDAALVVLGHHDSARLGFPDGQHVADADRPTRAALAAALAPHLAGVTEVWAPVGIGCHPDHLATRDAVVEAAEPGAVVHHYADVPYSLRYGWPPSVTGRPARPYLDVEEWLAEELAATGLCAANLTRTVHRLSPEDQRRKSAAMACYATQIPALDYHDALADGDPAVVAFEVSWSRS
jgi:LmbE family N-acetylglucosaminyl deacetylase